MYIIRTNGHYLSKDNTKTKSRFKAKTFKSMMGARRVITKNNIKKASIKKLEITLADMANSFDLKYKDTVSKNGLITIKNKNKIVHKAVDTQIDQLKQLIGEVA